MTEAKASSKLSEAQSQLFPSMNLASITPAAAAHNGWSDSFAKQVELEYRRLLVLVSAGYLASDDAVPPILESFWREHLWSLRKYQADMLEINGGLLFPTRSVPASEQTGTVPDKYIALYQRVFDTAPPQTVWAFARPATTSTSAAGSASSSGNGKQAPAGAVGESKKPEVKAPFTFSFGDHSTVFAVDGTGAVGVAAGADSGSVDFDWASVLDGGTDFSDMVVRLIDAGAPSAAAAPPPSS